MGAIFPVIRTKACLVLAAGHARAASAERHSWCRWRLLLRRSNNWRPSKAPRVAWPLLHGAGQTAPASAAIAPNNYPLNQCNMARQLPLRMSGRRCVVWPGTPLAHSIGRLNGRLSVCAHPFDQREARRGSNALSADTTTLRLAFARAGCRGARWLPSPVNRASAVSAVGRPTISPGNQRNNARIGGKRAAFERCRSICVKHEK